MADPHIQINQPPSNIPLLNSIPTQNHLNRQQLPPLPPQENRNRRTDLDGALKNLETFLSLLGFNQSSVLSTVLSWTAFALIGVLLPVIILELSNCSGCQEYQIKDFELEIVTSQACLAAVSLICLSHNLRKYGIRRFLFVDRFSGNITRYSNQYIRQIKDSLRLLVFWSLPIFILKVAREVIRILYVRHESWLLSTAVLFGLILSWSYLSTISLTASILFHLVCNFQVIYFNDYAKLLEEESDVLLFIEEHIRLRYHLSKISHRFRIFLVLQFCIVTASHVVTLFQTTGYRGMITVINGGDFAVSSVVQGVGIILCLHAATKISHRAQNIAALASRWHALATCMPNDASQQTNYSESDIESVDYIAVPTHTQSAPYMSSYHKRQAFVMYLQNNPGGITIFGWTVDRSLINIIFFIELTLVTFVLGQTVVFSSK